MLSGWTFLINLHQVFLLPNSDSPFYYSTFFSSFFQRKSMNESPSIILKLKHFFNIVIGELNYHKQFLHDTEMSEQRNHMPFLPLINMETMKAVTYTFSSMKYRMVVLNFLFTVLNHGTSNSQ